MDKLKLPEVREAAALDDASLSLLHRQIISQKKFLRRIYTDFYQELMDAVGYTSDKSILELGSGGGFLKELFPTVITSDIMKLPSVDKVFSAHTMPFDHATLDAIVMVDVLHHIPDVRAFFREATRCLKIGGRVAMIEPANTCWARFIYKNFHHEGFDPTAGWEFQSEGPLSSANGALPWIIFYRDRRQFESEFPMLQIIQVRPHTPFRYLLSGGLTLRQLVPGWSYPVFKGLGYCIRPLNAFLGMFQTIILEKKI